LDDSFFDEPAIKEEQKPVKNPTSMHQANKPVENKKQKP